MMKLGGFSINNEITNRRGKIYGRRTMLRIGKSWDTKKLYESQIIT